MLGFDHIESVYTIVSGNALVPHQGKVFAYQGIYGMLIVNYKYFCQRYSLLVWFKLSITDECYEFVMKKYVF